MSDDHSKASATARGSSLKTSAELARLLKGVQSEEAIADRAERISELIGAILRGDVKATLDETAENLELVPRIHGGGASAEDDDVPTAFTMAHLQQLFGSQSLARKQQIAKHTMVLSLFRGLLGPLDNISATPEPLLIPVAEELTLVYAQRSKFSEARGRVAVRRDLRLHRAYDVRANRMSQHLSVWDKLVSVGFAPAQMHRVLTSLAYLREGFAQQRANDGRIDPDQKGNWLHTMDELDAALDRTMGRPLPDIERALMGMFGDSWKTKYNFTRHNYDGAAVAYIVLSRLLDEQFTSVDLAGIVEANKEHQISPPGLMGILYANKIAGVLNADRGKLWGELIERSKQGELNDNERQQLAFWTEVAMEQDYRQFQIVLLRDQHESKLSQGQKDAKRRLEDRARFGSFITDEDYRTLTSIQHKISNPYGHELEDTASGGKAVRLTEEERVLLRLSGIDHWHVPHESTAWFWISRTGVVADILANLGLGGRCKLTRLNGPETDPVFQFGTIRECVNSGLKTYADIDRILDNDEHSYVNNRLGTMNEAIERAMSRLSAWLKNEELSGGTIDGTPFWDKPLKYPERGNEEANWWSINRIPEAQRSETQQAVWHQHRFDGLTDQERTDYQRAIRIRDRAVEELGRELRLDDCFVPDFKPVMRD